MLDLGVLRDFLAQLPCTQPGEHPEIFGPTDINAQSGNGRLSVAFNGAGTVTVFRWPRPSFYDQIKYHTASRDRPYFGAAPNAGSFLGLRVDGEHVWLRELDATQRHPPGFTDTVVTDYRDGERGLSVTVADVVAREEDALVREVAVDFDEGAAPESCSLVAFENCNLVVSKSPGNPVEGWCEEGNNTDRARYDRGADAILHEKAGTDVSTGDPRSVAVAAGFRGPSSGVQVGGDAHEPAARTPGAATMDAYENALDPPLRGNERYEGHTTGALAASLDVDDGADTETFVLAAGEDAAAATGALAAVREQAPSRVRAAKRAWLSELLADAPLPDTDETAVARLARRALVTLVTNYDPESGAIVASIATQSPYALDWPRDGAYFNHALHLLGFHEAAEKRNRWYAALPREGIGDEATPPGAWAMNYYADGVVGGPLPWEIDETAYAVWTLWDHYAVTGDGAYLADVYPAIRDAARLLCEHRDPRTGLHATAHEDDNLVPSQSVMGAGPVYLALGRAADAARELGETDDAERFAERREEVGAAIDDHLWNDADGAYSRRRPNLSPFDDLPVVGQLLRDVPLVPSVDANPAIYWPVGFADADDERMARHLDTVWEHVANTFDEPEHGDRRAGLYETLSLIALARAWRGDEERMERVRRGVCWAAREHATDDTHVMGEVWMHRDGDVVTSVSQPHAWTQLLFYYASLEVFPPDVGGDPERSVVERLRERATDRDATLE